MAFRTLLVAISLGQVSCLALTQTNSTASTSTLAQGAQISNFVDPTTGKEIRIPNIPKDFFGAPAETKKNNETEAEAAAAVQVLIDATLTNKQAAKEAVKPSAAASATQVLAAVPVSPTNPAPPIAPLLRPMGPAPFPLKANSPPIFKFPFFHWPKGVKMFLEPAIFFPWMGFQGVMPLWFMGPWFGHNFF